LKFFKEYFMKQKISILSALLCIAFFFTSCLNPTQSESGKKSNTGNGGSSGGGTIGGGTKEEIVEDSEFGIGDVLPDEDWGDNVVKSASELNTPDAPVLTLRPIPKDAVVSLPDKHDNEFFKLEVGTPLPAENTARLNALFDEETVPENSGYKTITIVTKDADLPLGPYTIYLELAYKGVTSGKTYKFEVLAKPATFTKTPTVYPYITGAGKNKLSVSWSAPSGAETFNIYYGTTASFEAATEGEREILATTTSSEITGLPDGTKYYVWVEAVNGSGSSLSPPAERTTSFTIPEFFYKDFDEDGNERTDFDRWDSMFGVVGVGGDDCYVITPPVPDDPDTPENEYKPARLEYGKRTGGTLPVMRGNIVYFDIFLDGQDEDGNFIRPLGTRLGRHGESLLKDGKETPAGVFIIEYDEGVLPNLKRFQGVYYYGAGAIQTVATGYNPPHVTTTVGLELCYFGNSYSGANPETDTLPEAIDRFTLANMTRHIAFIAIPWYRVYSATVEEEE
jgi:hypothetical protein